MATITRDQYRFEFDCAAKPVLRIQPGEEVTFETLDACLGEVRTVEQFLRRREAKRRSGPLSGPVYVEGAEPGDTLLVDILRVELDPTGFQLIGPNRAIIRDEIPEWTCYVVSIAGDRLRLPNGMELPIEPVVGTFGNAPAGEPTTLANRLGGNYDVPAVKTGSRLYLPIEARGALFSLGDVHARQGDGEVVGAPEIGARVTVRLSLLGGPHSASVMIEDATHWHTPCPGETEAVAARLAVFRNAEFIGHQHNIAFKDALILLTMIGQLSISRTGEWAHHQPIVCSSFAKETARRAAANYQSD